MDFITHNSEIIYHNSEKRFKKVKIVRYKLAVARTIVRLVRWNCEFISCYSEKRSQNSELYKKQQPYSLLYEMFRGEKKNLNLTTPQ